MFSPTILNLHFFSFLSFSEAIQKNITINMASSLSFKRSSFQPPHSITTSPLPPPLHQRRDAPTWNGERCWSVIVYRRDLEGWKKVVFDDPTTNTSSASTAASRNNSRRSQKERVYSPTIPRKGCILLPGLKQKWSLQNATTTGTVIRRGDKILLRSQGPARVLLLHFVSLEDCLQFADHFVALNPMQYQQQQAKKPIPAAAAAGLATATVAVEAATTTTAAASSPPKKSCTTSSQQQASVQGSDDVTETSSLPHSSFPSTPNTASSVVASTIVHTPTTILETPPPIATSSTTSASTFETEQHAANGMIARLLHDRDFLQLVHKIERYVLNTHDGAKMLQGLQDRDLSSSFSSSP